MLAAIVRWLEERDQTEGHGARVAALAEPVAQELGWTPERIAVLRHAAPIHDVGKLVVRAEVLVKPGPLSDEERDEMRVHPRACPWVSGIRWEDTRFAAAPRRRSRHERASR